MIGQRFSPQETSVNVEYVCKDIRYSMKEITKQLSKLKRCEMNITSNSLYLCKHLQYTCMFVMSLNRDQLYWGEF